MHAQVVYPPRVIPIVAAGSTGKTPDGKGFNVFEGRDDRIRSGSIHDGVMKRQKNRSVGVMECWSVGSFPLLHHSMTP
jgi:hypothetical protein